MLQNISIHPATECIENPQFSMLIPSWNNLKYLELCINSIRKNSFFQHQIIVVVNEGADGTLEWVKSQKNIDYVYARSNIGICYALNACRSLIKTQYVTYANDDMYFLPNWDQSLQNQISELGHNSFMLSATMIEPRGNNDCAVIANYGDGIETFDQARLLKEYTTLYRADWSGSTWPPSIMHIDCWDLVGGMSIEYSPGMYSDPDLSFKLWTIGVRTFIGKGNSLVYHFGCKSTGRVKKNKGYKSFTIKWGMSSKTFMVKYLLRGQAAQKDLQDVHLTQLDKLKQFFKKLKSIV